MAFIDVHRDRWGVEPICKVLQFAPSTYYAARSRRRSARSVSDAGLKPTIARLHRENLDVYGVEKMWRTLRGEGIAVGRDRVGRLMAELGLEGARRGKKPRTTVPAPTPQRPRDLVRRRFVASGPNRLWVADLTYVATRRGFVYTAFVIDVFSRMIVGWATSTSLSAVVALDALEMGIWGRRRDDLSGLVHHSDRGVQYLSVRYSTRLDDIDAVASVGSKGDSYDNALAETVNGLYKAELIHRRGTWADVREVEAETARWVAWWNSSRIHSALGWLAPAVYEARTAGERRRAA